MPNNAAFGHDASSFPAQPTVPTQGATPPKHFDGDDPSWAVAAKQFAQVAQHVAAKQSVEFAGAAVRRPAGSKFFPSAPNSIHDAGLHERLVESLVLKYLLNVGSASGRGMARQVGLPFHTMEALLHRLKAEQLVVFRGSAPIGDYTYELTDQGADRARRYSQQSTYFGTAPVPLEEYNRSVQLQALKNQHPRLDDVHRAFTDLVISNSMATQIGEAMNLGMGFFLYGEPGNGKTSIAERITQAYGESIWIPRAILAGGEILRLFDSTRHIALPHGVDDESTIDQRWVRIRRPTISVGGELQLNNLEVTINTVTGIMEAPVQMKANCGTFVIDDFGRHRFRPEELLNRLIVPLEKRIDTLNLPSGRSIQFPFEPMIVFSTNMDPCDLVDEAFLRRISYTIRVSDPTESEYRAVFERCLRDLQLDASEQVYQYLIEKHYRQPERAMRYCHPRDILRHVRNACEFRGLPLRVTPEIVDDAVKHSLELRAQVAR